MTQDRRPVVVIPASMMNRPSRQPTDRPTAHIGSCAIYPDRFYQATIGGRNVVVPGRYFRSRASRPGTFSIKVNRQRVKVPQNAMITEVSFNYSANAGASVPSGAGMVAIPMSGSVPRGFEAVCMINGQNVTIPRKHLRASNSRPGQMVVKYGDTTHLIAT